MWIVSSDTDAFSRSQFGEVLLVSDSITVILAMGRIGSNANANAQVELALSA